MRAPHRGAPGPEQSADADPVRRIERLFFNWVAESTSRVTIDAYRTAAVRLAPVRRREVRLIDGLAHEAEGLLVLADPARHGARAAAIKAFHARRIALATRLADLLRPSAAEDV